MNPETRLHANRDRQRHAEYDFVNIGPNQVLVTSGKVHRFSLTWPCSGMRFLDHGVIFTFAANGDLTDVEWFDADSGVTVDEPNGIDGSALVALSQDAQEYLNSVGGAR